MKLHPTQKANEAIQKTMQPPKQHQKSSPHLMEGKCLITTSSAWMVSNGTLGSRPERASCKACKLTQDIHFIATLNILSFPSPGSVTSSSTCNNAKQTKMILSI